MTDPSPAPETSPSLGLVATVMAIFLILVFLGMIALLAAMRGDKHWDRLVFLLTGLEAVVFMGAGALFGTTVHRYQVNQARDDAEQARRQADEAQQQAANGRALSAAVLAKAGAQAAAPDDRRFGRPDEEPGSDGSLDDLAAIARALLPPGA